MPEASSMCVRRYGNDGLKITASQLPATRTPPSMTWPAGVCIHELSARIQNAESVVPAATMIAEVTCTRPETRFMPKSITPRKVASRKNAVRTS
jgi:hypothetical protein